MYLLALSRRDEGFRATNHWGIYWNKTEKMTDWNTKSPILDLWQRAEDTKEGGHRIQRWRKQVVPLQQQKKHTARMGQGNEYLRSDDNSEYN